MSTQAKDVVSDGAGAGEQYATLKQWLAPLAFLMLVTVGVVWALIREWPCCEEQSCPHDQKDSFA